MMRTRFPILLLIACLAIPLLVGFLGGLVSRANIPGWYATLQKPPLTPPGWVFGPVWTVLYVFMGAASFLVVRHGMSRPNVRPALAFYAIQLILNGLWSPVFFGLHMPWVALAILGLLWFAVAITALRFRRVSEPAFGLMIPYLLWITFAGYLNAGTAWLN